MATNSDVNLQAPARMECSALADARGVYNGNNLDVKAMLDRFLNVNDLQNALAPARQIC